MAVEHVSEMLRSSPRATAPTEELAACIRECLACGQTCVACADACLSEEKVAQLRSCIRLNQDCAELCFTTTNALTRSSAHATHLRRLVELLADTCKACGDECSRHAKQHEHCRICAEACRACEQACRAYLGEAGTSPAQAH